MSRGHAAPVSSLPARLWQALDSYFFPLTTATRLAGLRILFVATQLLFFMKPLHEHLTLLEAPAFVRPQTLMIVMVKLIGVETIRTPEFIAALFYGTIALGLLALVGLFSRIATFCFGVGNILLISHHYSYGEFHHAHAVFMMAITFIGMGPCGKALSLDAWLHRRFGRRPERWGVLATSRYAMWPILLSQWLLCIVYFQAFAAKVQTSGLDWLNGYTLQNYLLADAIRHQMPLGMFLSQFHTLAIVFAIGTWAIEGLFFLVMIQRWRWVRRLAPWIFINGALLHTVIYLTQRARFFQFITLYAMWIPFERVVERWAAIRPAPPVYPPARPAAYFTGLG